MSESKGRDAADDFDVPLFPGLQVVAPHYRNYVLDLWGCIHDGVAAFPHAVACLEKIRLAGSKVVLLSNAPRRSAQLIDAMTRMGIARHLYVDVVSSGDATFDHLVEKADPFYAALGPACFHLGPERDRALLDVPWLEETVDARKADFVLNTGPRRDDLQVADHEDALRAWARRGVPMVCANPDKSVIRGGERIICAGALAERYEALGGRVRYHGKPFPEIYDRCLGILGADDRAAVLCVGDSLATDIRGAAAAGLDALLVAGGIHADEFGGGFAGGAHDADGPDGAKITAACRRLGLRPVAALARFAWGGAGR